MTEAKALGQVSPESVREATGRSWEEWLDALDAAGGAAWSHKEIVAHLRTEHPELRSGWWRQWLTVAYERARGKRAVGKRRRRAFRSACSEPSPRPPPSSRS